MMVISILILLKKIILCSEFLHFILKQELSIMFSIMLQYRKKNYYFATN